MLPGAFLVFGVGEEIGYQKLHDMKFLYEILGISKFADDVNRQ